MLGEEIAADAQPLEAKKSLGEHLAARFAGAEAAAQARAAWETRFSKRDLSSAELPLFVPPVGAGLIPVLAAAYHDCFSQTKSNSELRRLIEQGSIQADGVKLTDPKATPAFAPGTVLKLDKKCAVRIA